MHTVHTVHTVHMVHKLHHRPASDTQSILFLYNTYVVYGFNNDAVLTRPSLIFQQIPIPAPKETKKTGMLMKLIHMRIDWLTKHKQLIFLEFF